MQLNRIMVTVLSACFLLVGTSTISAAAPTEPTPGFSTMGQSPEGANDWSCTPSAQHPNPVVLVHGTGVSMTDTWSLLAPQLSSMGFCVFALNYGGAQEILNPDVIHWGISDISISAKELATFVDSVRFHTGARQVDIVGHSQGGVVARQYLKFEGGANPSDPSQNIVHSLVTLGATNHGTTFGGLQANAEMLSAMGVPGDLLVQVTWGPAGVQQLRGTPFLAALNAGSETQPGVNYTVIATTQDKISTPPEATFLTAGPGSEVNNQWVQDVCPDSTVSHGELVIAPDSLNLVKSALDSNYISSPCT